MQLNLNVPLLDLEDKPVNGNTLGQLLANALIGSPQGDAVRLYTIARQLWKNESVDLIDPEVTMLKTFVEQSTLLNNLTKAQVLSVLKPTA